LLNIYLVDSDISFLLIDRMYLGVNMCYM